MASKTIASASWARGAYSWCRLMDSNHYCEDFKSPASAVGLRRRIGAPRRTRTRLIPSTAPEFEAQTDTGAFLARLPGFEPGFSTPITDREVEALPGYRRIVERKTGVEPAFSSITLLGVRSSGGYLRMTYITVVNLLHDRFIGQNGTSGGIRTHVVAFAIKIKSQAPSSTRPPM